MNDRTLPLAGVSPVAGKYVVVKFDGGRLSPDCRILISGEIEGRPHVTKRMDPPAEDPCVSACIFASG